MRERPRILLRRHHFKLLSLLIASNASSDDQGLQPTRNHEPFGRLAVEDH
jgi:hypothetical protein